MLKKNQKTLQQSMRTRIICQACLTVIILKQIKVKNMLLNPLLQGQCKAFPLHGIYLTYISTILETT